MRYWERCYEQLADAFLEWKEKAPDQDLPPPETEIAHQLPIVEAYAWHCELF